MNIPKGERGLALFVTLVLIIAATVVALSSMNVSRFDQLASSNQRESVAAFMSAEYGASHYLDNNMAGVFSLPDCSSVTLDPSGVEQYQNVPDAQAGLSFRYDACLVSSRILSLAVEGGVPESSVSREVRVLYELSNPFGDFPPVSLNAELDCFSAADSNSVVDGSIAETIEGGDNAVAIATRSQDSQGYVIDGIENRGGPSCKAGGGGQGNSGQGNSGQGNSGQGNSGQGNSGQGNSASRADNYIGDITDEVVTPILNDPDKFMKFIGEMKVLAEASGRYGANGSDVGDYYGVTTTTASEENPVSEITYIDVPEGQVFSPSGLSGRGILIVDGELDWRGTPYFEGLVIVLGDYHLSGGGGGGVNGALVVSPMVEIFDEETGESLGWEHDSASVSISGGGGARYQLDPISMIAAFALIEGTEAGQAFVDGNGGESTSSKILSWSEYYR
ncbi:pilus assembly PilX N-terminal domain-containing protein [Halomonas sp. G15]|uniref:pilus assembly PilX family protein n=1 Tax=Halomonas sp. G15 TaxID=2903521 RepID=UPI001E4CEEC7|nr:pilus assembly PilX N-terminal domain-containing protein [Halomonas sp. G15]MCE0733344.1 pilus assembly PilX N-terminal domain-containing protein [Halomonas sp. G15]